jgi:hypothetical protein
MSEDAGIPQDVLDEVEKIKQQEAGGAPTEEEREAAPIVDKPLSRRAEAAQRLQATVAEAQARADAAVARAEAAERIAGELRAGREADEAWRRRMEEAVAQRQQPTREEPETDFDGKIRKQRKKADEALAANNLSEYHDRMEAITDLKVQQADARRPKPQAPPAQQPGKPPWVSAVESQFPEVVTHPNGLNAVMSFANLDGTTAQNITPERLQRAYTRAREELGLAQRRTETTDARRQMLSGAGGGSGGGGKGAGGSKGPTVNVPKNYREIARRAGMSPEEYVRAYADMNPSDVQR